MTKAAEENRRSRRDSQRHKRRHGQRGGSGKRTVLVQEQIVKRGREAEQHLRDQKSVVQPTEK